MTEIWQAIAALGAVLTITEALIALFVRLSIDSALMRFKAELIELLDERYVTRRECEQFLSHRAGD